MPLRSAFIHAAAISIALAAFSRRAAAQILPPPQTSGQIVINEIFYAPADKTSPEEFVELHNKGDASVDVSGWFFSDGISWKAPPGTVIPPGGYLVVAQNPGVLRSLYGVEAKGPYVGRLDNEGERLVLRNAAGAVEDEVDYRLGFPWPTTEGAGAPRAPG